jgi:hypothetical protein
MASQDMNDFVGLIAFLITLILYIIIFSPVFVARTLYEFYKHLRCGVDNSCLIKA